MRILFLLTIFINIIIGFVYSATIPGGWTTYDIRDEGVKNATTYAVKEFNKKSNSNFEYKLIKVVQSEGQTVAGINYRTRFVIGSTICKKNKIAKNCPFAKRNKKKLQFCEAFIYNKPWENYMEVISLSCKKIK